MRTAMALSWALFLIVAMAGWAQAAEVKTQDITFKSGDEEIKGFLAVPEGKGPFPAIVVIQEWWGLTDWIKDNAKRLAAQGYVTLAPDLYRGKVAQTPDVAKQLMSGLPHDRALRDLRAAVDVVAGRPDVKKERLGVIGWCMGGGYALQLALANHRIKACTICYGRVVTESDKLKPLAASVLGIFAGEDRGIPSSTVREFEEALKKDNKPASIYIFEGAGHGFMRPANDNGEKNTVHNADATKQAWQRIDRYFAETLGK
jgi:carboxymethylenebutenolidase